jgi:small subunit ribosomal protein S6
MRTYEVLLILSAQLSEDEVTSTIDDLRTIATNSGARLVSEDAWGRRRLAYPIEKANDGIYHLFVFETDELPLSELDRRMKNMDKVLRHLIVRTDLEQKRAVKLAAKRPRKVRKGITTAAAPAEAPVEAPTEAPTEAPVEAPVEAPAEAAAEAPAETPAEASTDTPAETAATPETPEAPAERASE